MTNQVIAKTLKEMMEKYDEARTAWVIEFNTAAGFDEWFTAQALSS